MEPDTYPLQDNEFWGNRAEVEAIDEHLRGVEVETKEYNSSSPDLENDFGSSKMSTQSIVEVDSVELFVPSDPQNNDHNHVNNSNAFDDSQLQNNTSTFQKYLPAKSRTESSHGGGGYSMAWQNITYTVPVSRLPWKRERKVLLQSITGHVHKGGIMALMGPSGSGKTTLLDILADRVSSGEITGEILINGQPRNKSDFRTYSCYVDVNDAFYEIFTVKETMLFTASLCFPNSMTYKEKRSRVRSVLVKVGLESCKHTRIGGELFRGLSTGQKRRLSIALELLKEPWLLFLDEPLSGLDGAAAANIMNILTSLADVGKTVVFSVHQPPSRVWNTFSSLTLLSGGLLLYGGPVHEAIPMLVDASGQDIPPNCNPADYMLDLVNNDFKGHVKIETLNDVYLSSQLHRDIFDTIKAERARALLEVADNPVFSQGSEQRPRRFQAGFFLQIRHLTSRALWNNIKHPGLYWSRILIYILLDLIISAIFTKSIQIKDEYKAGMIFFVQSYLVIMTVAALPYLILVRPVFSKERANGLVTVTPFIISTFIAMIPGVMLATLLSAFLIYVITGLVSFGWFFWILFCTLLCAESIMNLVASVTNQFIVGLAIGAGIYGIFMINAGFLLPSHLIPNEWYTGWRFFHHIAFHKYSLRSLMYNEFSHSKYFIVPSSPSGCILLESSGESTFTGLNESGLSVADQTNMTVTQEFSKCSPILDRYKMTDEDPLYDSIFILMYTLLIQVVLLIVTYFKHTGRR